MPAVVQYERERDEWLAIQARHLTALVAVAHQSSFAAAADQLGYVPSAISNQIAFLEGVVGAPLIERPVRARGGRLTEQGAMLREHAEAILAMLGEAKIELDALAAAPRTGVTLGVSRLFEDRIGPFLSVLASDEVTVAIDAVTADATDAVLEALESGEIDAALVELPIAAGRFSAVELRRDPCFLAVPAATTPTLGVREALRRLPLVRIHDCRATAALADHVEPRRRPHHTVESPAAALAFVRAGVAAAVVAQTDLPADDDDVRLISSDALPGRSIGLAWQLCRDGEPALVDLTHLARAAFRTTR